MESLLARLRRVPYWAWALVFGLAVCLPGLGGFGFWDPWELKVADQARDIAESHHLTDPTVGSVRCGDSAMSRAWSAIFSSHGSQKPKPPSPGRQMASPKSSAQVQ